MTCQYNINNNDLENYINNRIAGQTINTPNKHALVLIGGPGSGKSSIKAETLKKMKMKQNQFINIDPDIILSELFNNNNDCRPIVNSINDSIFDRAIAGKKNIIFDGTGKNFQWYTENVINLLITNGYQMNLGIVTTKLNVALERIKSRAKQIGRDVGVEFATSVYKSLDISIPQYVSLNCDNKIMNIFVYDNTYQKLQLILQTHCDGVNKVIDCIGAICELSELEKSNSFRIHNQLQNQEQAEFTNNKQASLKLSDISLHLSSKNSFKKSNTFKPPKLSRNNAFRIPTGILKSNSNLSSKNKTKGGKYKTNKLKHKTRRFR